MRVNKNSNQMCFLDIKDSGVCEKVKKIGSWSTQKPQMLHSEPTANHLNILLLILYTSLCIYGNDAYASCGICMQLVYEHMVNKVVKP